MSSFGLARMLKARPYCVQGPCSPSHVSRTRATLGIGVQLPEWPPWPTWLADLSLLAYLLESMGPGGLCQAAGCCHMPCCCSQEGTWRNSPCLLSGRVWPTGEGLQLRCVCIHAQRTVLFSLESVLVSCASLGVCLFFFFFKIWSIF